MGRLVLFFCLFISHLFVFTNTVFSAIQFTIDNPEITGTEINLFASISGLTTSSCQDGRCYLQGLFKQVSTTKYFGQTQNKSGSWIDYISTPEPEYIQSTFFFLQPESGSWSGKVRLRYLVDDSNYQGPGSYEVKLRRFSGKSNSAAGESNILNVSLNSPTPTTSPSSTPTSAPTAISPTPSPTSTPPPIISTKTPTPTAKPSPTEISTPAAEVLAIATTASSPEPSPTTQTKTPPSRQFPFQSIAAMMILIGGAGLLISLKYSSWLKH